MCVLTGRHSHLMQYMTPNGGPRSANQVDPTSRMVLPNVHSATKMRKTTEYEHLYNYYLHKSIKEAPSQRDVSLGWHTKICILIVSVCACVRASRRTQSVAHFRRKSPMLCMFRFRAAAPGQECASAGSHRKIASRRLLTIKLAADARHLA